MISEQEQAWRAKLEALREALEQELSSLTEASRPVELSPSIGRLTRMDALQQQQMSLAHRDRIRNRLQAISGALARLDVGSFGECLACGGDIEIRRLEARPEAFLCLDCQKNKG